MNLVEQLPREARFVRQVAPAAMWGESEYLLAGIADRLAAANWQRGGGRGAKPEPVMRPDKRRARVDHAAAIEQAKQARVAWEAAYAAKTEGEVVDDGSGTG